MAPAPAAVIDYLKDFSNAEEWDPGTVSCVRQDDGPIQPGSRWLNTSKIFGVSTELTYVLTTLTDELLVFEGENASATSTDQITVRPRGDGSEITYSAVISMKGLRKIASPVMKLVFERIGDQVVTDLTEALGPDR